MISECALQAADVLLIITLGKRLIWNDCVGKTSGVIVETGVPQMIFSVGKLWERCLDRSKMTIPVEAGNPGRPAHTPGPPQWRLRRAQPRTPSARASDALPGLARRILQG